jgi:hypothetical protein
MMRRFHSLDVSDEVTRLLRTVQRLDEIDQRRILKMVTLLATVPAGVRSATQRMLRELIASKPDTVLECSAGVDEVIEYLEDEILTHNPDVPCLDAYVFPPLTRTRN